MVYSKSNDFEQTKNVAHGNVSYKQATLPTEKELQEKEK
jgi:hypothetical protein